MQRCPCRNPSHFRNFCPRIAPVLGSLIIVAPRRPSVRIVQPSDGVAACHDAPGQVASRLIVDTRRGPVPKSPGVFGRAFILCVGPWQYIATVHLAGHYSPLPCQPVDNTCSPTPIAVPPPRDPMLPTRLVVPLPFFQLSYHLVTLKPPNSETLHAYTHAHARPRLHGHLLRDTLQLWEKSRCVCQGRCRRHTSQRPKAKPQDSVRPRQEGAGVEKNIVIEACHSPSAQPESDLASTSTKA